MNAVTIGDASASHPYGADSDGRRLLSNQDLDYRNWTSDGSQDEREWFGLPNGGSSDYYFSTDYVAAGGSENRVTRGRFEIGNTLEPGVNGRFFTTGDVVTFRLLYRANLEDLTDMIDYLDISDSSWSGNITNFNPRLDARKYHHLGEVPAQGVGRTAIPGQINALHTDITLADDLTGRPLVGLLKVSGDFLDFGIYSAIVNNTSRDGIHWQAIADASWGYLSLGEDSQSTEDIPKRYTNDQAKHYLDVSTIRLDQQPVFVICVASEDQTIATIKDRVEDILERYRQICSDIGMPNPIFLLMGQINHTIDNSENAAAQENNQNALLQVAQENSIDTCFYSIYAKTNGVHFNGNPDAVKWLTENDGTNFLYQGAYYDLTDSTYNSTLLDSSGLHPAGDVEAAFVMSLLGEAIANAPSGGTVIPSNATALIGGVRIAAVKETIDDSHRLLIRIVAGGFDKVSTAELNLSGHRISTYENAVGQRALAAYNIADDTVTFSNPAKATGYYYYKGTRFSYVETGDYNIYRVVLSNTSTYTDNAVIWQGIKINLTENDELLCRQITGTPEEYRSISIGGIPMRIVRFGNEWALCISTT